MVETAAPWFLLLLARRINHFSNSTHNQFRLVALDVVAASCGDYLFATGRAMHQILLKFLANLLINKHFFGLEVWSAFLRPTYRFKKT